MYKLTTPNNTLYNAKVNVTCVPGYHLNQTQENHPNGTQRTDDVTEIITCAETGNWSQISGCQPKETIIEVAPGLTSRTPENTKVDVNEDSEHQTSESKSTIINLSSVIGIVVVVFIGIVIFIVLRHKYARNYRPNLEKSHASSQYFPTGTYTEITST
ncbi:hypothetical protein DPMN_149650 [Dreissena polymorpha]|uniref:Sushi domain-containing protein n=1 Tax=Dreissena polymorpha TaxID=45954 RepID=A0A9D4J567_DREPO|nr:hypothetical protein DPMN_149650 [Dreissena polymorpha]